jgi:hypothetical protein
MQAARGATDCRWTGCLSVKGSRFGSFSNYAVHQIDVSQGSIILL